MGIPLARWPLARERGVLEAIASPEGSRRQTTTQPQPTHHTPRSACGLSYKGTSLGLRLDLTASRAGPAWGKGGSTFTGRGIAPLPTRREKKLLTHPRSRVKEIKRASRGQRPLTVITDNPLPSANDGRPHPRTTVSSRSDKGHDRGWGKKVELCGQDMVPFHHHT